MEYKIRGKIENRRRAGQIRDFSGLRWDKITPTDIDGFIDFRNTCFVFFELKMAGANVPRGQALAFERLTDALQSAGKHTVFIVAEHKTPIDCDIDCKSSIVTDVYYNRQYWPGMSHLNITLRQAVDRFLKCHKFVLGD